MDHHTDSRIIEEVTPIEVLERRLRDNGGCTHVTVWLLSSQAEGLWAVECDLLIDRFEEIAGDEWEILSYAGVPEDEPPKYMEYHIRQRRSGQTAFECEGVRLYRDYNGDSKRNAPLYGAEVFGDTITANTYAVLRNKVITELASLVSDYKEACEIYRDDVKSRTETLQETREIRNRLRKQLDAYREYVCNLRGDIRELDDRYVESEPDLPYEESELWGENEIPF